MAALMKQRVVHVFTHDSIGLGEDGPTHQSIEHAASLRLIPNLDVWRPCDTLETLGRLGRGDREPRAAEPRCCCRATTCRTRPSPASTPPRPQPASPRSPRGLRARRAVRGRPARPAARGDHRHRLGGRRSPCNAQQQLAKPENGSIAVRVVSMPSTTVFDRQGDACKRQVLPPGVPRIAVEMGVSDGWWKYGCAAVVGIDRYGESAPGAGALQALRLHGRERRRDGAAAAS